jgi:hypothetical protein
MPWSELFLEECSRLENSPTIEADARERRSNDDVETTGCRGPLQMLKSRALIGNFASLPGEDCRN